MNRSEHIERATDSDFDLCIIGGGASGAGCALDAALRGLKVCLIEKEDFAAATSSKSTKLIHGGVRYLEQAFKNLDFAQLKQVRHGLEERHTVLANAPHLARPLALITPVFSWIEGLYFSIGLKIYAWFASDKDTLPPSRWLSKRETLARIPTLNRKMHSSIMYYDGQLDDARYTLALIQSAVQAGATVVNHLEVIGFEHAVGGTLEAVLVRDRLAEDSGQPPLKISSHLFLNCTGPYADPIRLMANPKIAARIRPSKGVHVVLPYSVLNSDDALLIPKTPDGRVVFAIPFAHQLMLGTTDNDYATIEQEPILEAAEVDFLLETLQPYIDQPLDKSQVKAGFGGLRPLIAATGKSTKGLVRDHEVEYDPESNLLSLLGGKWTTYRLMAKDAVDKACELLGNSAVCATETHHLAGSEGFSPDGWQALQAEYGWPEAICRHLNQSYGSASASLAALTRTSADLVTPLIDDYPYIRAEVVYSAQNEMCCTIRDFLARRVRLEISDWQAAKAAAGITGELLGQTLGWSASKVASQVAEYENLIDSFVARAKGEHVL